MNLVPATEFDEYSSFTGYKKKILDNIYKIADSWFIIAYAVYEINYYKMFTEVGYENIVDCCSSEFGFKKSTTYNFIRIVEQFAPQATLGQGSIKLKGCVAYYDFSSAVKGWSYSQLLAMLSLSAAEREQAKPEMSVREIKSLHSKRLESSEDDVSSEAPAPAPSESELFSKRLESLEEKIAALTADYERERESNHRINVNLVNMTMERDGALQQVDKLKAENKRLRAQIKSLKSSSGCECK